MLVRNADHALCCQEAGRDKHCFYQPSMHGERPSANCSSSLRQRSIAASCQFTIANCARGWEKISQLKRSSFNGINAARCHLRSFPAKKWLIGKIRNRSCVRRSKRLLAGLICPCRGQPVATAVQ
jgi:hypothetical protein